MIDNKLEKMLEIEVWESLFPEFCKKRINPEILALLSQPKYRYDLVKMIADRKYHFGVPREIPIPKSGGGTRFVYVLPDLDRCLMAVIGSVYTEMYSHRIHPACKSYQKGLSVPAVLHKIMPFLDSGGYKVDLSKYFDSVPRWKVNELLKSMDTDSPVDELLWDFYNTDLIIRNGNTVNHYKSLGQGCAMSPLLANLCLAEIDSELSVLCDVYVRYSDDLLILGKHADEALGILQQRLADLELTLNPKKIKKIDQKTEFTFLGGKVCKNWVRMSEESWKIQKNQIRNIVKRWGRKGNRMSQKRVVQKLRKHFLSKKDNFCMMEYFCFLSTDEYDMRRLDEYCRNEIKAIFTGKHNHATNEHKTSNDMIRSWGWVSLVHLFRLFKMNRNVFDARLSALRESLLEPKLVREIDSIWLTKDVIVNLASSLVKCGTQYYRVRRKSRVGVLRRIEDLWPLARLYEGFTALNVSPDFNRIYSLDEYNAITLALKEIELLIVTTKWDLDQFFWQSSVYSELIIFSDWCIDK